MRAHVTILDDPLDPKAWFAELAPCDDTGAMAAFVGKCRGEKGRLVALELEHYPGMAEAEIGRIMDEAHARWELFDLLVVHRTGMVKVGEPIVLVAAGSVHRDAAFDAVRFVMDFLKTDAPFWKREHLLDGTVGAWIEAKEADDAARDRWARPTVTA
ncbi:molybdenum cofactor biosynthesis protein MoaE [Acuticoccus sp. I52.16.1]|uniref:molybdenum cofactor biosynthesis protein MoaE n=1 Tax=Acuticoccus sp. I52.16.1 TaxID=2928472 RepID=UPI001FD488FC|nr:molybdenum cofactor biosynthesis protein MoaE [Acuticoccus sp. I52.16.1]UOM35951.1 molybdenum cofactor biosynthesis protein MoaE [Acuticoccus sp. I52.16.1]